jgi:hypothetical protein
VGDISLTIDDYYAVAAVGPDEGEAGLPPGIDAALRSIFEDLGVPGSSPATAPRKPATGLIARLERDLIEQVYRWTGHFPERTRPLLRHLARRADAIALVYPEDQETHAIVALTTLVTTLAMNYVQRGSYVK